MVRVNGKASLGKLMNVYPDPATELDVLHLYLEVPVSEFNLWTTNEHLTIEADWKRELGGMKFVSQKRLAEVLEQCSAQGQFKAKVQEQTEKGWLPVTLHSMGPLKPLESLGGVGGETEATC